MATQTLAEAAKLINNEIVAGVAEDIISINPIYTMIPFTPYTGQAILVNRENALGDASAYGVGSTITSKNPATFVQVPFAATKLIGDAEIDGLVVATSESAGVDQVAIEISSKAKSVSRRYQSGLALDDGSSPHMNSLHSLCDSSQFTGASAGQTLSFALLDELMMLVVAKDGQVDWLMMTPRTLRSYRVLVRALGGMTGEFVTMLDGRKVDAYMGVPIFRNDYLSVAETANGAALTGGALASVWAGVFDDGSSKVGIAGIYPGSMQVGIQVEQVGPQEAVDARIWRVKWYTNFVNFNRRGLARLVSVSN